METAGAAEFRDERIFRDPLLRTVEYGLVLTGSIPVSILGYDVARMKHRMVVGDH